MPTYPLHQLCKFMKTQKILISQTFFQLYDHKTKKAKKLKKYHAFHNVPIFNMHFRKSSKSSKIYHRNKGCIVYSVMSVFSDQDVTFSLTWALHSFFISSSIFSSLSVSFCFSSSFVSSSFCLLCMAVSFSHTWTVFCFSRSSSVLQRTRAFCERTEPLCKYLLMS